MHLTFKILFDKEGNPKSTSLIQRSYSFSKNYCKVVKSIIAKSSILDEKSFRLNIATLMPAFKMTRRGVFHGMRIQNGDLIDSESHVLDACWVKFGKEFEDLKIIIDLRRNFYFNY